MINKKTASLGLLFTAIILFFSACNSNEVKSSNTQKSLSITKTGKFIPKDYAAYFYDTPLFYSVALNRLKDAEKLLKEGADVNADGPMKKRRYT